MKMSRLAVASLLLLASISWVACREPEPLAAEPDPAYVEEVRAWHERRQARLRQPDGWLSLVGLHWLEEGASSFGSAPTADVVFPAESAPLEMGRLLLEERRVTLDPAAGVEMTLEDGTPITGPVPLLSDAGQDPTVVRHGTLRFHVIERGERVGIRVKDSNSPVRAEFTAIETYPIDPAWRIEARFVPYDPPKILRIPDVLGAVNEEPSPGALAFTVGGREYRLDPTRVGDELFVVFADATNGDETYGGGRFVYTELPDDDGAVVLDFNKAYNPPCVFTPYSTCPLPPADNRLPIRIEAGEKMYAKGIHHPVPAG